MITQKKRAISVYCRIRAINATRGKANYLPRLHRFLFVDKYAKVGPFPLGPEVALALAPAQVHARDASGDDRLHELAMIMMLLWSVGRHDIEGEGFGHVVGQKGALGVRDIPAPATHLKTRLDLDEKPAVAVDVSVEILVAGIGRYTADCANCGHVHVSRGTIWRLVRDRNHHRQSSSAYAIARSSFLSGGSGSSQLLCTLPTHLLM